MFGSSRLRLWVVAVALLGGGATLVGQNRLQTVPGYSQYARLTRAIPAAWSTGAVTSTWQPDSRSFEFRRNSSRYRFDVATLTATELEQRAPSDRRQGPTLPERGRQYTLADSPDGRFTAFYQDRNIWLRDASGEHQLTTDGSVSTRVKNGTASWVYGEELDQRTAMWWSPDGSKLAYYRFDESRVPDYYVALDQTDVQDDVDVEAYPKAGVPNPLVDLFVYDVATHRTTRVDVRDGQPFEDEVVGYYVYRVAWSPDGRDLLFNRTNRHQNVLELVAADPATGRCRTILRDEWPASWTENHPAMYFLADGHRFVWESERNGWNNLYLYDLSGRLITPLTEATSYEIDRVVAIDEPHGRLFYLARDGANHMKLQLHRVNLSGHDDRRLTDPAFTHAVGRCVSEVGAAPAPSTASCGLSPDGRYFVDVYETHDTAPSTRLADTQTGRTLAAVATGTTDGLADLHLRPSELFTFPSADPSVTLHGLIRFPPDFDASRRYPVLLTVYAGPDADSTTATELFTPPSAVTGFRVLLVTLNTRAAPGRGKRLLDSIYLKLGQTEVDDLAAGIRALDTRPYVDPARVAIYGTSYGGYASLLAILRYPDLFAAASASSPVTTWANYDTIYTERYMRTPQENAAGYEAGSAMTYVGNLHGRLLLYYGTADNNVHPSNTLQLIQALQEAGKSFDVQVGPDKGHSGVDPERMLEFFADALQLRGN
jgi:dipeptidyl-peptidase-4